MSTASDVAKLSCHGQFRRIGESLELDFTGSCAMLTPITVIIQILGGLGVIAAASAYIRHYIERRCWRNYKTLVDDWIDRLETSGGRHPKELEEHDWRVECERMLYDSNSRPSQIQQLLETAVIVAKGIAAGRDLL